MPMSSDSHYYFTPGAAQALSPRRTQSYPSAPQGGVSSHNVALPKMRGVMALFHHAGSFVRMLPQVGKPPKFENECQDCGLQNSKETVLSSVEPWILAQEEISKVEVLIKKERFEPFSGLGGAASFYQNLAVKALGPFEQSVLRNLDEYDSLCPGFKKLDRRQRKVVITFLISEIFEHNGNDIGSVRHENSVSRAGMCDLSFEETQRIYEHIYKDNKEEAPQSQNEFLSYARNKKLHMNICVAKIFFATTEEDISNGYGLNMSVVQPLPLQRLFPKVDFGKVKDKLGQLSLCQSPSVLDVAK